MYGVKGGKAVREYPTTKKVMEKFYEYHPPSYDPDSLEVAKVSIPSFR